MSQMVQGLVPIKDLVGYPMPAHPTFNRNVKHRAPTSILSQTTRATLSGRSSKSNATMRTIEVSITARDARTTAGETIDSMLAAVAEGRGETRVGMVDVVVPVPVAVLFSSK